MTVSRPAWLDGTFDDAMRMVARRAVVSREVGGLVKRADIMDSLGDTTSRVGGYLGDAATKANDTLSGLVPNEHLRRGLIGLGVGGGLGTLGGLLGKKKKKGVLGSALTGALLGGALGGGGSMLYGSLPKDQPGTPGPADLTPEKEKALAGVQGARQELGLLGANPNRMNKIMAGYRGGQLAEGETRSQLAGLVPDTGEQLTSVPDAMASAFGQNRYGQMLAQADVLGLKNVTPYSGHFDPTTAGLAVGANVAARTAGTALPWLGRKAMQGASYIPGVNTAKAYVRNNKYVKPYMDNREVEAIKKMIADPNRLYKGLGDARIPAAFDIASGDPKLLSGLTHGGDLTVKLPGKKGPGKDFTVNWASLQKALKDTKALNPKPGMPGMKWDPANKSMGWLRNRVTGGPIPLLASMLPLLYKEWAGGGYRTGEPAINELMASQQGL